MGCSWDQLREKVFWRDWYTCVRCGLVGMPVRGNGRRISYQTSEPGNPLSLDHILPRAQGGVDHVNNLQTLCFRCNTSKGPSFYGFAYERRMREGDFEPPDPEAQFPPEGY